MAIFVFFAEETDIQNEEADIDISGSVVNCRLQQ